MKELLKELNALVVSFEKAKRLKEADAVHAVFVRVATKIIAKNKSRLVNSHWEDQPDYPN